LSIRARLLIIALLATLLPALLALLRFQDDRQARIEADGQRLASLAQVQAEELRQRILATTQLQFGLARASDLTQGDRAVCSAFLSEVREAYPQYTGILTVQPDGRLFCDSLRSGRELDLNDRDYFRRALATHDGAVLEPTFGRLTGRAVLQVAYPVRRDDDSLRFVLLASLDLARMLTPGDRRVPGRRVLLVDDKGQVMAVAPAGDDLKPGATLAGTPLGRFATESRAAGRTEVEMAEGRSYLWVRADTQELAPSGLRVLAGAPETAIVAEADRRFRLDLAWYAALAAAVFAVVWWMSDRAIRQPLERMTGMAGRMAAGDLQARIDAPLPSGELGVLAAALNQAAVALKAQREDIEALHARLLQSQRLEAVGQLTGGVAHDFNNLLTVVLGNADLLAAADLREDQRRQALDMLIGAAERGAVLTRQLLAFARKQPLAPSEVDVNQLVAGIDPMLRRTLGEHIEIEIVRGAGLWTAMVDPTQLESALLNLCLNARDAMPGGGRLTLETANAALDQRYADQHADVVPGQYTMVAVSDTGTGIEPAHLARVFEPFFTTKEKGKGTGLGLAMVYGFVKQSGGHVGIYSERGHGTTVKLYLPRAVGPRAETAPPVAAAELRGGAETVLVVEDDEPVRLLAGLELRAMGYRVIEAASGAEAMRVLEQGETVDLLFTDIVMPGGMSGRELADAAWRLRPGLRVLFTSGYTENAIVHHGRLDPGVQLLPKPYRRADLARAVRVALERPAAAG
jgi:signal transduction histidine kinase/ActR/RegA family two-component response regulator